jgi:hypothetical protein
MAREHRRDVAWSAMTDETGSEAFDRLVGLRLPDVRGDHPRRRPVGRMPRRLHQPGQHPSVAVSGRVVEAQPHLSRCPAGNPSGRASPPVTRSGGSRAGSSTSSMSEIISGSCWSPWQVMPRSGSMSWSHSPTSAMSRPATRPDGPGFPASTGRCFHANAAGRRGAADGGFCERRLGGVHRRADRTRRRCRRCAATRTHSALTTHGLITCLGSGLRPDGAWL